MLKGSSSIFSSKKKLAQSFHQLNMFRLKCIILSDEMYLSVYACSQFKIKTSDITMFLKNVFYFLNNIFIGRVALRASSA